MTIETFAGEELTLSFEERQAIVDNASDVWLNQLPLEDTAVDAAILDFQARMLPEIYPDYNLTAVEIKTSLQLEQRYFVLRGIANSLHLDEYRATAVAQRMGVHYAMMFASRCENSETNQQPTLFNYWSIVSHPDTLAV
jgi:hypothetical protein